jgi:hypothetical protein
MRVFDNGFGAYMQNSENKENSEPGLLTVQSSKERKLPDLQSSRAVNKIRKIEIRDIVANYDIRIDLLDKFTPCIKHVGLTPVRNDLRANDAGARVQSEHISDKWFWFA